MLPPTPRRTALRTLKVDGCAVSSSGAEALAAALEATPNLSELSAIGCDLTAATLAPLVAALGRSTALKCLRLRHNSGLCDAGAALLADGLTGTTALRVLDLGGTELGDAGADAVVALLPRLPSLKSLHLGSGAFCEAGVAALVGALAVCESLEHVVVMAPNMTASSDDALRAVFYVMPALLLGMSGSSGAGGAHGGGEPYDSTEELLLAL